MGKASISFECDVVDKDLGGKLCARGFSRHAIVNDLRRTTRIPADLRVTGLRRLLRDERGTLYEIPLLILFVFMGLALTASTCAASWSRVPSACSAPRRSI